MTLTSAQSLRLKIADAPKWADLTRYGDGTATVFGLDPYTNITSGSAFVAPGGTAWSATGATYNQSGFVTFANVISAGSAYRLTFNYSVFSDTEIDQFLTDGATIVGAAIEAVGSMMFDAARAASWSAADGSSFSNTATQGHLRALYDLLKKEQDQEAVYGGGMNSWAENQELY